MKSFKKVNGVFSAVIVAILGGFIFCGKSHSEISINTLYVMGLKTPHYVLIEIPQQNLDGLYRNLGKEPRGTIYSYEEVKDHIYWDKSSKIALYGFDGYWGTVELDSFVLVLDPGGGSPTTLWGIIGESNKKKMYADWRIQRRELLVGIVNPSISDTSLTVYPRVEIPPDSALSITNAINQRAREFPTQEFGRFSKFITDESMFKARCSNEYYYIEEEFFLEIEFSVPYNMPEYRENRFVIFWWGSYKKDSSHIDDLYGPRACDGESYYSLNILFGIDLDKDGHVELIVQDYPYDGFFCSIRKYQEGRWKRIFRTRYMGG